jgi:hypothetical protein
LSNTRRRSAGRTAGERGFVSGQQLNALGAPHPLPDRVSVPFVSRQQPERVVEFGLVDGVRVAGLRAWPALAAALREQLVAVGFARAAAEGRDEKMAVLYRYLAGDEFRGSIEAMVEAFTALRASLDGERAAMERLWKEREKQLQRLLRNTGGLYGEVRGIIGNGLAPVPGLELDGGLLEDLSAGGG